MSLKHSIRILISAIVLLYSAATAGDGDEMHPVMRMELFRLRETRNILRQYADRVWPGWEGFDEVPFLFAYENGVRMLVGHPAPPPEFEIVEGAGIEGKQVFVDRSREIEIEMAWPMEIGGGVSSLGTYEGKTVRIISINPRSYLPTEEGIDPTTSPRYSSENAILLYIHELFHVFQRSFYEFEYGNLQYNPDVNYAVYSEIEGRALLAAFREKDAPAARDYLEDFIVARKLKFRSMAETERLQELSEDINEGTARYAEYAVLRNIERGYSPVITERDDSYFHKFDSLGYYFERRMQDFTYIIDQTLSSKMKCYYYGCFQALLLDRYVDGWKEAIGRNNGSMFALIDDFFAMNDEEEKAVAARLGERYGYDSLVLKHGPVIEERDRAFAEYNAQEGTAFIVSFEPILEFPLPRMDEKTKKYTIGYRSVYPEGISAIEIREVLLEGKGKPLLVDQIYYLKSIDTDDRGYEIDYSKRENDIYYDATVNTSGFTLKAPKIEVRERGKRIKFIILSKVSERGEGG